ncbi:hypothetical protein [Streptomyces sp. NPDC002553]|uniref:hypothetical protein n=1 Tax=Streptomyces sp. NPDC002553 TaxID=3154417 RepID=UPI00332EFC7B
MATQYWAAANQPLVPLAAITANAAAAAASGVKACGTIACAQAGPRPEAGSTGSQRPRTPLPQCGQSLRADVSERGSSPASSHSLT